MKLSKALTKIEKAIKEHGDIELLVITARRFTVQR